MKNTGRTLLTVLMFGLTPILSYAQNWVEVWQHEKNFYTIQDSFNAYCKRYKEQAVQNKETFDYGQDDAGLFPGYAVFKRWAAFVEPRVYPSGDLTLLSQDWNNYQQFLNENNLNTKSNPQVLSSPPWTAMGPFGPLVGNATNGLPRKAGRLNFITFVPGSPNAYWVGAAAGGLWKTTNNGGNWSTNTDYLDVIGCTDLAIDPTNPNIMYLATGDGYGSFRDPSSIGVLKSTDGGSTWLPTGLTFQVSQKVEMRHILINPLNPQILLASTSIGIFRNTNGGAGAWTNVQPTNTFDLEFKPGSSDTIYAGGVRFRRSVDGGQTWVQISNGIPTSGSNRMEVATTPANSNIVYVVSSASGTSGLQGIYRSLDGGTTFSLMANTPDIVASDCFITSTNGQGWYDLAIDASPTNANEVVVGGLGVWRSLDGGSTWSGIGCAYNWSSPVPYIHTDHHELEYTSGGILYSVNDGGVCQYTGASWTDLTSPMNIAQIYKIGLSSLSPNLWITGHQDNGSNIYNNGLYMASLAADGTDCFIDRTNNLNMFACIAQGQFYKSTNGGGAWSACVTGLPAGGWVSPWKQDPVVATTLYCGRNQMYRSVNSAGNWTITPGTMSPVVANEFVTEFAIAPSNNQYLYVIHGNSGVFTTNNAGTTWTQSNTGLPVSSAAVSFISVDPGNPLVAWVTFSGYSAGNKVFKTVNGGASWQNISYNLPNLPTNCSVYETGTTTGRIYIGMDLGVYYLDNSSTTWSLYNTSLPNTPVMDMEISPASPFKLRAATYGRGVYQCDILTVTSTPDDALEVQGFSIYPNPANNLLYLNIPAEKESEYVIEMFTVSGALISTSTFRFGLIRNQWPLDISSLTGGIYFVKATAPNGVSKTIKLIKS